MIKCKETIRTAADLQRAVNACVNVAQSARGIHAPEVYVIGRDGEQVTVKLVERRLSDGSIVCDIQIV